MIARERTMPARPDGEVVKVIDGPKCASAGWAAPYARAQRGLGVGAREARLRPGRGRVQRGQSGVNTESRIVHMRVPAQLIGLLYVGGRRKRGGCRG